MRFKFYLLLRLLRFELIFQMQVLCVLNEQKDLVFHNFINLEEESEEESINRIVIFFQAHDKKQIG